MIFIVSAKSLETEHRSGHYGKGLATLRGGYDHSLALLRKRTVLPARVAKETRLSIFDGVTYHISIGLSRRTLGVKINIVSMNSYCNLENILLLLQRFSEIRLFLK